MQKVIVIGGPTASGKTSFSIKLARIFPFEIVSADSMQIYSGLDIATAKPTLEERQGVPHYLIDVVSPWEKFSVGDYVKLADKAIEEIASKGKIPLVCGGTGFYIKALLEGIGPSDETRDDSIRQRYEKYAEEKGKQALWQILYEKDPERAEQIHFNNMVRVIRALEIIEVTGKKASENVFFQSERKYDVLYFTLCYPDKEVLNQRIDRRVDWMIENGLKDEAEGVLKLDLPLDSTAWQAIGYKEIKESKTMGEAIKNIKLHTRQYAKRQVTWFRAVKDQIPIDMSTDQEKAIEYASEKIRLFLSKPM